MGAVGCTCVDEPGNATARGPGKTEWQILSACADETGRATRRDGAYSEDINVDAVIASHRGGQPCVKAYAVFEQCGNGKKFAGDVYPQAEDKHAGPELPMLLRRQQHSSAEVSASEWERALKAGGHLPLPEQSVWKAADTQAMLDDEAETVDNVTTHRSTHRSTEAAYTATEFDSLSLQTPALSSLEGDVEQPCRPERAAVRMRSLAERENPEEFLGLDVRSVRGRFLQVVRIDPTGAAAHAEEPLQVGDLIHRVNGIGGSWDRMVHECALRADLQFEAIRPDAAPASESDLDALLGVQGRPALPPLRLPTNPGSPRRRRTVWH